MVNQLPEYLYKYRPINKNTIKTIVNNELYFSSPEEFNDPFDSNIIPAAVNQENEAARNVNYKLLEELRKTVGICCFSKINDDMLMYSHYANSHKGICLVFRVEAVPQFFELVERVTYSKYPKMNYTNAKPQKKAKEVLKKMLCYKAPKWKYEKEWRIIWSKGSGVFKFPEKILSGIIFGCQMSNEDKELIKTVLKNKLHKVQLYQATKKEGEFGLDIVPIDI